jgi:hypothetical protein
MGISLQLGKYSSFILALLAGEGVVRVGVEDCPIQE